MYKLSGVYVVAYVFIWYLIFIEIFFLLRYHHIGINSTTIHNISLFGYVIYSSADADWLQCVSTIE